MRKSFLHVYARLSKSESDELRSTLKFLTGHSSTSSALSSFFRSTVSDGNETSTSPVADTNENAATAHPDKEESQYIDSVVKLLNASLPQPDKNKRNIRQHYDLFYGQLKNILDQSTRSAAAISSSGPGASSMGNDTSEDLYNKLIMSQLTENFSIREASKIVLSKKFHHFEQLMSNITVFPKTARLELSLLVYYRTMNSCIKSQYHSSWIASFNEFPPAIQRVFWRGLYNRDNIEESKDNVVRAIANIKDWDAPKTVTLYQALFEMAHTLPRYDTLSRNQGIFVSVLRILSPHKQLQKYMVKVVKLSMETKLVNENHVNSIHPASMSSQSESLMSHYKFVTSLDVLLHEIYNSSTIQGPQHQELLSELEDIFTLINNEEEDVKSRMSLRYT